MAPRARRFRSRKLKPRSPTTFLRGTGGDQSASKWFVDRLPEPEVEFRFLDRFRGADLFIDVLLRRFWHDHFRREIFTDARVSPTAPAELIERLGAHGRGDDRVHRHRASRSRCTATRPHRATVEKLDVERRPRCCGSEAALPTHTAPRPKTPACRVERAERRVTSFLGNIAEKSGTTAASRCSRTGSSRRNEPRGEFMALQRSARARADAERGCASRRCRRSTCGALGSFGPAMLKGSARFRDGLPREVAVTPAAVQTLTAHDGPGVSAAGGAAARGRCRTSPGERVVRSLALAAVAHRGGLDHGRRPRAVPESSAKHWVRWSPARA